MSSRVLLIGVGDLGRRIATLLVRLREVRELVLVCRPGGRGGSAARLLAGCGDARVRGVELDALDTASVERLIRRERPDLIVQCAARLSPFYLTAQDSPLAAALREAGFAVQLPAQLPILLSVMRAVRSSGHAGPVVNCSYPDVTHPMLAPLGLAPTVGVGNVGMIAAWARAALRDEPAGGDPRPLVRVLAHHGHVIPCARADPGPLGEAARPRIFVGEAGRRADALAFAGPPIPITQELNAVTAAHACEIVGALLSDASIRTSAPGPLGLGGGYPIRLGRELVALDLPAELSLDQARHFHAGAAALDGVAAVDGDGRVSFTDCARARLSGIAPELVEPLAPAEAEPRFARLALRLGLPA